GLRMTVIDYFEHVIVSDCELREALALFTLAADIFPKSWAVQHYIGLARQVTGDRDGAIAAYRKAIELVPGETPDEKTRGLRIKEFEKKLEKLRDDKAYSSGR